MHLHWSPRGGNVRKTGQPEKPLSFPGGWGCAGWLGAAGGEAAHFPLCSASRGHLHKWQQNYDASCLHSPAVCGGRKLCRAAPPKSGLGGHFLTTWPWEAPDALSLRFLNCKMRTAALALPTASSWARMTACAVVNPAAALASSGNLLEIQILGEWMNMDGYHEYSEYHWCLPPQPASNKCQCFVIFASLM